MEIQIQSVGFKADAKLKDFATSKIEKLVQFSENLISAEIYFKLENTQAEDNKISEVKLEIPGSELFAKKQAKSFEEAIDTAVEALRKQILKAKDKASSNKK